MPIQTEYNLPPDENIHSVPTGPAPTRAHRIFFGEDGLRAGWSLLIFIAIFAGLMFSAAKITHALHHPSGHGSKDAGISLTETYVNELVPFLGTLLATWIMSKIERRRMGVYGLGGQRKVVNFVSGLATGLVFLSALVLLLTKTGLLVVDGRSLFGTDVVRYGVEWLGAFFLIAMVEEYLVRGYVQYTLSRGLAGFYRWAFKTRRSAALGFWTSALLWSMGFGLIHGSNPGESPIGLLCAGLAALMFCFSLWRTGSLWWAIGVHTTWDYAQSFLYGVGDSGVMMKQHLLTTHPAGRLLLSGGTTGPEGSLFVLPMMALIVVVLVFTVPKHSWSYQPEQMAQRQG